MKKIPFSFGSKKTDFPAWPVPSESPAGFPFNEGWMDVELAPFVSCSGYMFLDMAVDEGVECDGSLGGMGHVGGPMALFSNADLAENFALPGHSNPVSWRAPGNSGPWRVSSFKIGTLSLGSKGSGK